MEGRTLRASTANLMGLGTAAVSEVIFGCFHWCDWDRPPRSYLLYPTLQNKDPLHHFFREAVFLNLLQKVIHLISWGLAYFHKISFGLFACFQSRDSEVRLVFGKTWETPLHLNSCWIPITGFFVNFTQGKAVGTNWKKYCFWSP